MRRASSPATTTGTGSARCTSIRWRGSGRCCGAGCGRTGGSPRRSCRCTWDSSSSCITSDGEARPSSGPWSDCSSNHPPDTPDEPGVFTGHFLDGLRGAARGDGGVIRILDLYSYVQEKVVADQPNQRPVLKVELEENYPIVLYRGGKPPETGSIERPEDGFKYDVFLSYRGQDPDKTWVRRTLYPRLKAEGLKVCLDAVDFRLGEPVIHEMERAVTESRYTMAVLTPAYLTSNFADFENVIAQHLGLEQSQRRFLGLLR